ncbi:MAG TPA: HAD family phosphatase [Kofleriaceae bacterium]|nr:HAD family phosphatase [Kofleriaceae bacterium]
MIRGFLFDLDGTLVDTERESGEAMARALLRGQQIAIEQSDRDFIIGRSWMAIYDRLKSRYPQLAWTRDEVIAQTAAIREEVFAEVGVTVMPHARETLAWTRTYPRAIITGSARAEAMQVIPLIGPDSHFDTIVAAEDVPRSKPHPDGYQKAMGVLGLPPHECIVIEDSESGIEAGRSAGCLVVAVRAGNFGGWRQDHAHHVIDTLAELTPSLVEELTGKYLSSMGGAP